MPDEMIDTGATGFLGPKLIRKLYETKHNIAIFAIKNSFYPSLKEELFEVNVHETENVMKACLKLGIKKVVHVSSTSVLGVSTSEKIMSD